MQKFTRALTREVEIDGQRMAVTLSEQGVSIRPVGSRKPPVELTWSAILSTSGQMIPSSAPAHKDESDLGQSLTKLDAWLAKNRPGFHDGLMESATPEELDALSKALGHPIPADLKSWLAWHNGQGEDEIGSLVGAFNVISSEEIAAAYHERQQGASAGPWDAAWIPLLDDFQGNLICLDTSRPGHPIVESWRGQDDPVDAAPSLLAWVDQFLADCQAGLYAEDSERGEFHKKS